MKCFRFALGIVMGLVIASYAQASPASKPAQPKAKSPTPTTTATAQKTFKFPKMLVVGTKHTPPFVIKHKDGHWSGISVDLWKEVAAQLNVAYKFREYQDLATLLQSIPKKEVHLIVSPLTITLEREAFLDFTHSFYSTGLGIAHVKASTGSLFKTLGTLFTPRYLKFFFGLFALLVLLGLMVWWVERRANPDEFGGAPLEGVGSGIWWSIVTMTTVGYGDKSPKTFWGRVLATVWILASLVIISSLTAVLASLLTVNQLDSTVGGPDTLYRLEAATIKGSTSMKYLQRRSIAHKFYPTLDDAMKDVVNKKIDVVVYDKPFLQYLAQKRYRKNIHVHPSTFERQDYGIALPEGSLMREKINRSLLRILGGSRWTEIRQRYLGKVE